MNQIEQLIQQFQSRESSALLLHFLQFFVWVVFVLLLVWAVRKGISKTIHDNSTRYRANKVVRFVGYFLVILLAIISFTGKMQYFSLAIGLLSAGLAFALQEVILSVAGWITIISSGTYKTGDRIEINNVKGDVIDIGITRTTLMELGQWITSDNYTGRIVQISNSFVFKGPVSNYSTDFPFVWEEINLPIQYGSDIQLANELLMQTTQTLLTGYADFAEKHWEVMVKKYLIEQANVAPSIALKLTDNWIEFNLRYVVDYRKRRITKTKLYTALHEAISKTNGRVKLASATFEVTGLPNLDVIVSNKS